MQARYGIRASVPRMTFANASCVDEAQRSLIAMYPRLRHLSAVVTTERLTKSRTLFVCGRGSRAPRGARLRHSSGDATTEARTTFANALRVLTGARALPLIDRAARAFERRRLVTSDGQVQSGNAAHARMARPQACIASNYGIRPTLCFSGADRDYGIRPHAPALQRDLAGAACDRRVRHLAGIPLRHPAGGYGIRPAWGYGMRPAATAFDRQMRTAFDRRLRHLTGHAVRHLTGSYGMRPHWVRHRTGGAAACERQCG